MIAATILAAGTSERMGYAKALLTLRGRTFLQTILDATAALGLQRRLVVLGRDRDKILSAHDLQRVEVLSNEQPEAGPIGSIRAAVRQVLNHPVDALLVWPVDFPHVTIGTVQALIDRFRLSGPPIVVPAYQGRRGHPVIFGRPVFDELLSAPDAEGAKAVVHADSSRVVRVPVADPSVVDRLNTPQAYEDILRRSDERRAE